MMRRSPWKIQWYQVRNRSTSVLPAFQPIKIDENQREFTKRVNKDIEIQLSSNLYRTETSNEVINISKYYFDGQVRIFKRLLRNFHLERKKTVLY